MSFQYQKKRHYNDDSTYNYKYYKIYPNNKKQEITFNTYKKYNASYNNLNLDLDIGKVKYVKKKEINISTYGSPKSKQMVGRKMTKPLNTRNIRKIILKGGNDDPINGLIQIYEKNFQFHNELKTLVRYKKWDNFSYEQLQIIHVNMKKYFLLNLYFHKYITYLPSNINKNNIIYNQMNYYQLMGRYTQHFKLLIEKLTNADLLLHVQINKLNPIVSNQTKLNNSTYHLAKTIADEHITNIPVNSVDARKKILASVLNINIEQYNPFPSYEEGVARVAGVANENLHFQHNLLNLQIARAEEAEARVIRAEEAKNAAEERAADEARRAAEASNNENIAKTEAEVADEARRAAEANTHVAEEARDAAEEARDTAEEARDAAEEARDTAEEAKLQAQAQERIAEAAKNETADKARRAAEAAKKVADKARRAVTRADIADEARRAAEANTQAAEAAKNAAKNAADITVKEATDEARRAVTRADIADEARRAAEANTQAAEAAKKAADEAYEALTKEAVAKNVAKNAADIIVKEATDEAIRAVTRADMAEEARAKATHAKNAAEARAEAAEEIVKEANDAKYVAEKARDAAEAAKAASNAKSKEEVEAALKVASEANTKAEKAEIKLNELIKVQQYKEFATYYSYIYASIQLLSNISELKDHIISMDNSNSNNIITILKSVYDLNRQVSNDQINKNDLIINYINDINTGNINNTNKLSNIINNNTFLFDVINFTNINEYIYSNFDCLKININNVTNISYKNNINNKIININVNEISKNIINNIIRENTIFNSLNNFYNLNKYIIFIINRFNTKTNTKNNDQINIPLNLNINNNNIKYKYECIGCIIYNKDGSYYIKKSNDMSGYEKIGNFPTNSIIHELNTNEISQGVTTILYKRIDIRINDKIKINTYTDILKNNINISSINYKIKDENNKEKIKNIKYNNTLEHFIKNSANGNSFMLDYNIKE
jgi:hypothetical protein